MTIKQLTPAQVAATRARQEAASVSPAVAASMGSALGTTFNFDPNAVPNDLPEPGATPSGAPQGGPRPGTFGPDSMIGAQPEQSLPDDRDSLVATGALPEAPGGAPPPQAREPAVIPGRRLDHPLLTKLRQDLGIDQLSTHDVKIGGHEWRLVTLAAGDLAMATRLADQLSESVVEHQLIYQGAIAAHAVVAIDGVPSYQVFGVETPGVPIPDPYRPPRTIRHIAALRLHDFISEGRTALPQRLYEAYVDRCDSDGAVDSYMDDPSQQRVTFRCQECDHSLTMVPRYKPGTQDVILPFCQWDASSMAMEQPGPLA